jgi:putative ABC transport system permease protein
MIGLDLFGATFPDAPRLAHALRIAPEEAAALAAALVDDFGLPPDRVADQAAAKRLSMSIFERTFAVTGALNLLTLGVAALALLASLVTLSGMRLPQLAPVWAMGLTRRRLAALELLRTLVLAALTALVALPVGLGLAWVLLAVINVDAFGWRLPMHVFPADWATLGVAALAAALLAAAWPARRLAAIAPAELLRLFARER